MPLSEKQKKVMKQRSEKKLPVIVGLCLCVIGLIILFLNLWRIIVPFFVVFMIFRYFYKTLKN